jgi:hypothetical protein
MATISGTVEDASGSAVGGATVTVKSLENGATRVVTTAATGKFRFLSLPLGRQEVKAEKRGFKAAIRKGINLEVGQEADIILRVEVGDFVQQIIVSEDTHIKADTVGVEVDLLGWPAGPL